MILPLAKFFNSPMPNDCLALQSLHTVILNVVVASVIVVVSDGVDIVNFYHKHTRTCIRMLFVSIHFRWRKKENATKMRNRK